MTVNENQHQWSPKLDLDSETENEKIVFIKLIIKELGSFNGINKINERKKDIKINLATLLYSIYKFLNILIISYYKRNNES